MSISTKLPAAMAKGVKYQWDNKYINALRYICWNYGWSGRQYGLQYHDQCFEPAPEVQEALRRLRLKDPHMYDLRLQRLTLATMLTMSNQRLSKDKWTQWDEETFYLKPYLDEIEAEKLERTRSTGIKPGYQLKPQP